MQIAGFVGSRFPIRREASIYFAITADAIVAMFEPSASRSVSTRLRRLVQRRLPTSSIVVLPSNS